MVLRAVSEREIRESREDGGRASEATGDEEQSDELVAVAPLPRHPALGELERLHHTAEQP